MKTEKNFIDYGIYIDRKQSFIISLNHVIHEELISEDIEENGHSGAEHASSNQENIQNSQNEQLKKFCKNIIAKIENAHHILIFGPSVSKFELQKEIKNTKRLKEVTEELIVTDNMDKNRALQYAIDHFTSVAHKSEEKVLNN